MHPLWNYTPSYRALGWRELSSGDDAWTGFLLGGVLWALFPPPDLTAEAAPGSRGPIGWSGITLACTGSTRLRRRRGGRCDSGGRRHEPVVGPALRIHRRPRGQPLGDHLVTTGHLRRARRPAVLGLMRTGQSSSASGNPSKAHASCAFPRVSCRE